MKKLILLVWLISPSWSVSASPVSPDSVILQGVIIKAEGVDHSARPTSINAYDEQGTLRLMAYWDEAQNETPYNPSIIITDPDGKNVADLVPGHNPNSISKSEFADILTKLSTLRRAQIKPSYSYVALPIKSECPYKLSFTRPVTPTDKVTVKIIALDPQC